jgi:hypothetical protein
MSASQRRYEAELESFADLLKVPRTAKELSKLADCSKMAVYHRIDALKARQYPIQSELRRASKTGPMSEVYWIPREWFEARDRRRALLSGSDETEGDSPRYYTPQPQPQL